MNSCHAWKNTLAGLNKCVKWSVWFIFIYSHCYYHISTILNCMKIGGLSLNRGSTSGLNTYLELFSCLIIHPHSIIVMESVAVSVIVTNERNVDAYRIIWYHFVSKNYKKTAGKIIYFMRRANMTINTAFFLKWQFPVYSLVGAYIEIHGLHTPFKKARRFAGCRSPSCHLQLPSHGMN